MVTALQSADMHETLPPRSPSLGGGQTDDEANQQLKITQYSGDPKWRARNLLCPRHGCGRFYSSESALRNHLRLKHPFDGLRPKRQTATAAARTNTKVRQQGGDDVHPMRTDSTMSNMSTNSAVIAPSPHSEGTPSWSTPDPTQAYPYHPGSVPANGSWNQPHPYAYGSPYPPPPHHGYEYSSSPSAARGPPPAHHHPDYAHRVSPSHHSNCSPYDHTYPYPPQPSAGGGGPVPPPPSGGSSSSNSFYAMMIEEAVYTGAPPQPQVPHPHPPPPPHLHPYSYHPHPHPHQQYPNAYPGPPPPHHHQQHPHPMRRPSGSPVHGGAPYGQHACECAECARVTGNHYGPPPPPRVAHYGPPAPAYSMSGPPPQPVGPCMCPHCVGPAPPSQGHGYGAHPPPHEQHMYHHDVRAGVHAGEGVQQRTHVTKDAEVEGNGKEGVVVANGGEGKVQLKWENGFKGDEQGQKDVVKMDDGKEAKKPKRKRSAAKPAQRKTGGGKEGKGGEGQGKGKGKGGKKVEVKVVKVSHSDSETEDDLPVSS